MFATQFHKYGCVLFGELLIENCLYYGRDNVMIYGRIYLKWSEETRYVYSTVLRCNCSVQSNRNIQ
jgi:hypothetical protein